MVLDYVFIAGFDMGIGGAAIATGLGYSATAVVGLFVFSRKKSLPHYVGEDGVAAVTIIMYVLMFASSLYTGYCYGVAPMLAFALSGVYTIVDGFFMGRDWETPDWQLLSLLIAAPYNMVTVLSSLSINGAVRCLFGTDPVGIRHHWSLVCGDSWHV